MPMPAQAEGEDRVLVVARVVVRRPVGGQDREVGLAAEPVVERRQLRARRRVRPPVVLEPARPDLGVGPAVDAARGPVRRPQAL